MSRSSFISWPSTARASAGRLLPGDTVHYHMIKRRNRGRVWRFEGKATVNGQLVAEAEISAMIVDPKQATALRPGIASERDYG